MGACVASRGGGTCAGTCCDGIIIGDRCVASGVDRTCAGTCCCDETMIGDSGAASVNGKGTGVSSIGSEGTTTGPGA